MKRLFTFIAILFAGYAAMAQCNPSFTWVQSPIGNNLLNVNFTNTTVFTPGPGLQVYYSFDYGDGSSGGSNTHLYANSGNYTVVMTMTVDTTVDSNVNVAVCSNNYSQNVTVAYTACGTSMSSSVTSNTGTSETVNFIATNPAGTTGMTYTWDFGDGSANGSGANVNHTYTSTGFYYVTLTATNGSCTYTNWMIQQVVILNCDSLFANFTYTAPYNTAYFTNTSTYNVPFYQSLSWDYGDGNTGSSSSHIYSSAGTYNVTLTTTWFDDSASALGTCIKTVTHAVTVGNAPNKIAGNIYYNSGNSIDSNNNALKVWLIQLNGNILSAVDSTTTANAYGGTHYEFDNEPTGVYMTKAELLTNNTPGVTGYVPTYATASLYWSGALNVNHTGGDDEGVNITMQTGTVTSGPGFVAGNVLSGANKGTDAGIPAVGMTIYLRNATTNNVIAYQFTDVNGDYTFNNIPTGTYNVYPEALGYGTTPYPTVTVTNGQATVNNVNFRQHTTDMTITPVVTTGVSNVTAVETKLNVYPNPANGQVNVQWQNATAQVAHVSIANVVGQKVFESNVKLNAGAGSEKLDISTLKDGLYMMTIKSDNINYSQKLIIQH